MTEPQPDLRQQLAAEFQRLDAHEWGYDHGFSADVDNDPETASFVDAVLALFRPLLDAKQAEVDAVASRATAAIAGMGADVRQARRERDRYRSAWLSARQRAEAYGEGILRHVEDRDTWMGWAKQQAARVVAAEAELTSLRTAARTAAVSLRDTAERVEQQRTVNAVALRAAATALDEITGGTP